MYIKKIVNANIGPIERLEIEFPFEGENPKPVMFVGDINNSIILSNITGIVVIDEIELHLHSTLQRETLPKLIALFPKVQFIISTHSPLFLLGMNEKFGEEGFDIYQMPKATKISAERFSEFQKAYTYLTQTQKHEDEILEAIAEKQTTMLIITEGSSDWKHMKAAYYGLKKNQEYKDIFNELEFEFLQYDPPNSSTGCSIKLEMGNSELCSLCKSFAKLSQQRKLIFIADRDDKKTNETLGGENDFKKWGNNVYSLLLPVPENRRATPNICIEHLYPDDIIKRPVCLKEGDPERRLYMGNEFDSRGISQDCCLICEKKNRCGSDNISIIEGSSGERVTFIKNSDINIALPKMEFAKMILDKSPPFDDIDFSSFLEIFKILKDISKDR